MFTDEQKIIIDAVLNSNGSKVIGVNAVAGSGKSTTAKGIIDAVQPVNGIYTAFNKSVIAEAKRKMKGIDCRTMHSLAYKYINYKKINDLTVSTLDSFNITFKEKKAIITKINDFFVSKYISYNAFCSAIKSSPKKAEIKLLQMLSNKELPVPFNFLLKAFHCALAKNQLEYDEYDLLILDECQDTSAVVLEIFMLLKAKKRVVLGDTHQNIYNFMNTVNAFTELNSDQIEIYNLTKSFRCTEKVAEQVQKFGENYFGTNFQFKGTDNPPNKDGSIAILTRTNSALLEIIEEAINEDLDFKLYRNPYDIAEMFLSLKSIASGSSDKLKEDQKYKYAYLIKMYNEYISKLENDNKPSSTDFFNYLAIVTENDEEIVSTIKTIRKFYNTGTDVYKIIKLAQEKNNINSKLSLSTVHTFKGLEADTVYIHKSLNDSLLHGNINDNIEPYNIYYVALSRAKYNIKFLV